MAYGEAGGSNTYIADFESSGRLMTEYSRNPKSFPINQYSEIRPVTKKRGFYLRINPEQASRLNTTDGSDSVWAPGADRPTGQDNLSQFTFVPYASTRHARSKLLEDLAVEQSAWPVAEQEVRALGQQSMTELVQVASNSLANASWPAGNTSTAATLIQTVSGTAGQNWTNATPDLPYIRMSLLQAAQYINIATGGVVTPKDLVLVLDPVSALKLAINPEVVSAMKNSVWAYPVITGTLPGAPGTPNWTLPPQIAGFRVVVDDTVVTTSKKGASSLVQGYVFPTGTAYLLCRKENEMVNPTILKAEAGELTLTDEQREAVPITSTFARLTYEEFTTENEVNKFQRRTVTSTAYDYQWVITSFLSGYKITGCFG